MKNKILTLIIGALIGAIITTSAFLAYNKILQKNSNQLEINQMKGNGQMQEPLNENMKEPHERPNKNGGISPEMSSSLDENNI